jgi:alkylation response protein AidB-like acyl-CoA dehydrogenase
MSIALTEEHQELARVARSFLEAHGARAESRALLEAPSDRLPRFWKDMAELGWMGLHVDEARGGYGFGLPELSIVLEALGYAMAPGPFLPTTLASALLVECGSEAARGAFLPGLADGSLVGAVGLGGNLELGADGRLAGSAGLVVGAELAGLLVVCVGNDIALLSANQRGVSVAPLKNVDPSRRVARVICDGAAIAGEKLLRGARRALVRLARTLSAAEAAGGARACTEIAIGYAKDRKQFGRPIGTFGPVKHHCANMLVATEQATAGAWGAARADLDGPQAELAAATACALALPALTFCSKLNVQVHGGIGFTWENDAHLFVRRAIALEALFGPVDAAREDVARLLAEGVRTKTTIETESIVLMNLRGVIRAVEGSEPGAEANITKLAGSELVQRKAALMARLAGPAAAVREGEEKRVASWLMATLGATIGGGTSEILRNQIGERLLGLPRDPLIQ